MSFANDFMWGAATASYQIEGAADTDGRGRSVWDDFCEREGAVFEGHSGKDACQHYERYREDVENLAKLGVKYYRFSIAWPRVYPKGDGEVNEKGLRFYEDLVDALLERGIDPCVTLFHWDMPSALQMRGAWQNPASSDWFARYTETVMQRLGSKVRFYFTFNEPQCFIGLGYGTGEHAPGMKLDMRYTLPMVHNVLLAHGKAAKIIRHYRPDAVVGFVNALSPGIPRTEEQKDIDAARSLTFARGEKPHWAFECSLWNDPLFFGTYPECWREDLEKYLPSKWEEDLETIHQVPDVFAVNIYQGVLAEECAVGYRRVAFEPGHAKTAIGWPVTPEALYWGPYFYYEKYGKPILVTENGLSCHDVVSMDGKVHDPNRMDFLHRYLGQYKRAAEAGVPLKGYFHWSLMDNFEWAKGYNDRFGLIYVNYQTQERIWKDSAYWYRDVVSTNGEGL